MYWKDLVWLSGIGKLVAKYGAHLKHERAQLDDKLAKMLDRYGGTDDAGLEKHVRMVERHLHGMFACAGHPEAEPTDNASRKALKYYVILRKVIGQTRGGARAMRRLGDFASCVVTWGNEGKNVMGEVAGRV